MPREEFDSGDGYPWIRISVLSVIGAGLHFFSISTRQDIETMIQLDEKKYARQTFVDNQDAQIRHADRIQGKINSLGLTYKQITEALHIKPVLECRYQNRQATISVSNTLEGHFLHYVDGIFNPYIFLTTGDAQKVILAHTPK